MAPGLRALGVALLLAGCAPVPTVSARLVADANGPAPAVGKPPDSHGLPASDLLVRETTPALDFSATLAPEMALAPVLAGEIKAEALAYQEKMQAQAATDMKAAEERGFPARPYAVNQRWTTEAETPALLAFSGLLWEYTGGAHGNSNFAVVLYDRAERRRIETADLFTDPKAALSALRQPWCAALAEERKARRSHNQASGFDDCPALGGLPIVPVAGGQGAVTGFKVLAAPYVAGPYAEGSYELLVPADPVLPFLKPEWRATFGATDRPAG